MTVTQLVRRSNYLFVSQTPQPNEHSQPKPPDSNNDATMEIEDLTQEVDDPDTPTPMDTDDERGHQFFVTLSFRDRAQVDAAYAHILKHVEPGEAAHESVYGRVLNPVFICWEDL